jgi:hypothetical protein
VKELEVSAGESVTGSVETRCAPTRHCPRGVVATEGGSSDRRRAKYRFIISVPLVRRVSGLARIQADLNIDAARRQFSIDWRVEGGLPGSALRSCW